MSIRNWPSSIKSLVKAPVPFSPLKPLIDFAAAIGFKGPPDRYEEARKIIAANKAEAAAPRKR